MSDSIYKNILQNEGNVNIDFISASKDENTYFYLNPNEVEGISIYNIVNTSNTPMENEINNIFIKKTKDEIEEYKRYTYTLDLLCKAAKAVNEEQQFVPDWSDGNTGLNQKKYFIYYSPSSKNIAVDYTYEYFNSPLPTCIHFKDLETTRAFINRLKNEIKFVMQYQMKF